MREVEVSGVAALADDERVARGIDRLQHQANRAALGGDEQVDRFRTPGDTGRIKI
jgi:hypothetical protein